MPARGYRLARCLAFALGVAASSTAVAGKAGSDAHDVAIYALGLVGVTYRFGGNTPESGLDCSGFVRHVYQEVTGTQLPRTSKEMSGLGAKVNVSDLLPGDLVFFNTRRFAYSHVGIYLGDNRFVHAPSRGGEIQIARITQAYWQRQFNGARRLVAVPATMAATTTPYTYAVDPADATP